MAAMEPIRGITGLQQQNAVATQNGSTIPAKTAAGTNTEVTTSAQQAGTDKMVAAVTSSSSSSSNTSSQSDSSTLEMLHKQDTELIARQNEQLRKSVEQINKSVSDTEVLFGYHDETHQVILKIVDKNTKKVIRELPPEKTLDMIVKVWEMAGILVDEKR